MRDAIRSQRTLDRADHGAPVTAPASYRVAVVGCGRISRSHFEALGRVPGLSLTAVCDINVERARAAGEEFGVPWFRTIEELLAKAPSDVVAIATPSGLHPQQGIQAAAAGKHVIVEKPMAITLSAADELVHACDHAGVHLFVVKQNRLNATVQLLRRAVDKGRFGRIYMANCTVRWARPQSYYEQAPWRGT